MPSMLIKDMPSELHSWLRREAARNRRSMTQHLIFLIAECMRSFRAVRLPPPVRTRTMLTAEFLDKARRQGRA